MKKHSNIPIFIPHLGCPNNCVFCNQHTISGVNSFDADSVIPIIESALSTIDPGTETEIAFFGGSFTGIDRDLMLKLLKIAYGYIERGKIAAIRCSTRPDYITVDILSILKKYGVKTIELGLQSISDKVLFASKRGHSFDSEKTACEMIVNAGFSLVGQMMIGLPSSTLQDELDTADFIISVGASAARIYPTVVFKGTELCQMTKNGNYRSISLEDAVKRSAAVMKKFIDADVDVIRIGLCSSENLSGKDTYFSGPNHPAIGELVQNEIYYNTIESKLAELDKNIGDNVNIYIPKGTFSKVIGHKKNNQKRIEKTFSIFNINYIENENLAPYEITVMKER